MPGHSRLPAITSPAPAAKQSDPTPVSAAKQPNSEAAGGILREGAPISDQEATGWLREALQKSASVPPGAVPGAETGASGPDEAKKSPNAKPDPLPLYGTDTHMKGDPKLLTADSWDPVRVKHFETDSRIVQEAQKYYGTPYVWGSKTAKYGLDCSGLSWLAMKGAGVDIPAGWFSDTSFDPRKNPERGERYGMKHTTSPVPGDVVVFGTTHIGIYIGDLKGERMYISANHGGPNCTSAANSTGRVDVMKVSSHHVQPPVYYHYTGKDPAGPKQKPTTKDPKQEKGVPMSGPDDLPDADESVMT
jgi:cell wall-associated NlpC family hydrolase